MQESKEKRPASRLIEEFLTQLVSMSQQEKLALLYRVEGLTSQERARGNWSTRLIARYLGLHKNSYRTVAKIVKDWHKQGIDSNLAPNFQSAELKE